MCGVIGVDLKNPTEKQLTSIRQIVLESEIRGKHSFGFCVSRDNDLETVYQPTSKFNPLELIFEDRLLFIAHTRYSTSGEHPQPITKEGISIVHNGVVTQEELLPSECETDCDSELILNFVIRGGDIKKLDDEFPRISYAILLLRNGSIEPHRNGLRPLWRHSEENGTIFASTDHILTSSGFKGNVKILSEGMGRDSQ